ncbi:MAG: hypothetical protein ABEN55_12020 [Bradymonadaceae bacterium]
MNGDPLPEDVEKIGRDFVESVEFPFGEIAPGEYKFKNEDAFWYRFGRMFRTRRKFAEIWPYKARARLDGIRQRGGLSKMDFLDLRLYQAALNHAEPNTEQ